MENKKTKLTISGSPKKSFKNLSTSKNQGKKTVVIEKKLNRSTSKGNFSKPFGSRTPSNLKRGISTNFNPTTKISTSSSCIYEKFSRDKYLIFFFKLSKA